MTPIHHQLTTDTESAAILLWVDEDNAARLRMTHVGTELREVAINYGSLHDVARDIAEGMIEYASSPAHVLERIDEVAREAEASRRQPEEPSRLIVPPPKVIKRTH